MSTGTELFLCWFLLSWGLVSCRSTASPQGSIQLYLPSIQFTFKSLKAAEDDYVTYVFGGSPPEGYRTKTWTLIEGISLSTISSDIVESSCNIVQYLDNHLPNIVRISSQSHQQPIIQNITEFNHVFKQALNAAHEMPCQTRSVPLPNNKYKKKVMGLRILFSTRQWLTHLTSITQVN